MTAPDHRPYLLPTDLRTAEDAAEWLREHAAEWRADARAHPEVGARLVRLDYGGAVTLDGALSDLTARLDRERRQACRRGALDAWRCAVRASRISEIRCSRAGQLEIAECKRRALAFRAAAKVRP